MYFHNTISYSFHECIFAGTIVKKHCSAKTAFQKESFSSWESDIKVL